MNPVTQDGSNRLEGECDPLPTMNDHQLGNDVLSTANVHAGTGPLPESARHGPPRRVLVVYREGRGGEAALREGAELAAAGAELSVVTLAPQAKPLKCCKGGGAGPYNCAVRAVAHDELRQARELLGSLPRVRATTLKGTPSRRLAEWSAVQQFDVVIVDRARFARGGGRLARQLRAATTADVRLVG